MCNIQSLNDYTLSRVFDYLDRDGLKNASRVSRRWCVLSGCKEWDALLSIPSQHTYIHDLKLKFRAIKSGAQALLSHFGSEKHRRLEIIFISNVLMLQGVHDALKLDQHKDYHGYNQYGFVAQDLLFFYFKRLLKGKVVREDTRLLAKAIVDMDVVAQQSLLHTPFTLGGAPAFFWNKTFIAVQASITHYIHEHYQINVTYCLSEKGIATLIDDIWTNPSERLQYDILIMVLTMIGHIRKRQDPFHSEMVEALRKLTYTQMS